MTVNGHAPGVLAEACERFWRRPRALFHRLRVRRPAYHAVSRIGCHPPLNWYGETKLAGEKAVLSAGVPALILRTSAVYSTRRPCFLATVRRIASQTGGCVSSMIRSPRPPGLGISRKRR